MPPGRSVARSGSELCALNGVCGQTQRPARDSRNAAISSPLRTSRTSPTSTGWFQVLPSMRREPRELRELVGGRPDQRQLTLLRQHQQQVLVGQQDELAVAVASALPLALAVLEVDAREDAAVEAEGMALVNDEVVEVRLQPVRRPALFDGPSAGSVRDRDAAHADAAGHAAGADQDVAVRASRPAARCVPPCHACSQSTRAVGRRDAGRAGSAQQQDLRDAVDRRQMRRAVAPACRSGRPSADCRWRRRRRRASRRRRR